MLNIISSIRSCWVCVCVYTLTELERLTAFLYSYIQVYIGHRPLVYVLVCENVCQCSQISLVCLLFSLHATLELTPGWADICY